MKRSHLAFGFLVVLAGFLVVRWLFAEPTITANFVETPLHQVLRTMERQGKVTLRTNLDPDTPVTLQLHRAPVVEAIDLLAVRLDADWRWALVVGPDRGTVAQGLAIGAEGRRQNLAEQGWRSFFYATPWQNMVAEPPDPRRFDWTVEAPEEPSLTAYLDQASQKLPVQILVPAEWEPTLGRAPRRGSLRDVVAALLRPARGESAEVFFVTRSLWSGGERPTAADATNPPPMAEGTGGGNRGGGGGGGGGLWMQGVGNSHGNQQWLDERNDRIIAALPPEEQSAAREAEKLFREFRESTRDLSPEDRRAVASNFFSRPEVQQQMEEISANRDAKRTPEQREARYRRVVDRKLQAREAEGRPLTARP